MTKNYILMIICLSIIFLALVLVLALKTKKH
jgi:hypothetical protein